MRLLKTTAVLILCLLAISTGTAQAIGSEFLSYQGKLDSSGTPLNGNRDMTFRLFPTPTGGTLLWQEQALDVPVSSGLFTHLLGSVSTIPDSAFNFSQLWLEVEVEGQAISARSRLTAVAVSKRVASIDGASGGTITSKVSIGPGHSNTGAHAFVAGENNTASGDYTSVGGGAQNTASGSNATVGGGESDTASGLNATVGGGLNNKAGGPVATVGGGRLNTASEQQATVSGGDNNTASGFKATVPGGAFNTAAGGNSFAAGLGAKANHDGTFVWGDNTLADFASTASNQFLIRAGGGVGIGIDSPASMLQVVGGDIFVGTVTAPLGGEANLWVQNSSGDAKNSFRLDGFGNNFFIVANSAAGALAGAGIVFRTSTAAAGESDRMAITEAGNVGIGTTSPAHPLHMASGAHVTAGGVWTNASSRELKTEIEPLKNEEYSDILKKLEDLDVVHFKYKSEPDVEHIGMIAEDVPDEIASPDRKGIPTADAIAFLMAAVKAQQNLIENQNRKIAKLENTLTHLGKEK